MKYAVLPLALLSAVLLSGCDAATIAAITGGKGHTIDDVLAGYTPTVAGASGAPADITTAINQGVQGFGVGSGNLGAAATLTGTYINGEIHATQTGLDVTVDGSTFHIPATTDSHFTNRSVTAAGHTYQLLTYSDRVDTLDAGQAIGLGGNVAVSWQGQYASLTGFLKNLQQTYDHTSATPWNGTYDGFSLLATGIETPTSGLPTTIAYYNGYWFVLSNVGQQSATGLAQSQGVLHADVNFGTKEFTLAMNDFANHAQSTGSGIITGNKFTGTMTHTASGGYDGDVVGQFDGPNANELVGAGSGSTDGQGAVTGFIATNDGVH